MQSTPLVATLTGLLVGVAMLLVLVGGTATLVGCLIMRLARARWDRRHPGRAAVRQRSQQARRVAAEWPLLAKTLRLGYQDQWTGHHRFPIAEFVMGRPGRDAPSPRSPVPASPTTSG
jgi:hypothetical protein